MVANLGQFSKISIRLGFMTYVYPCLLLTYLGQGARLVDDAPAVLSNVFFQTIPGPVSGPFWWITWTFALLSSVIASQGSSLLSPVTQSVETDRWCSYDLSDVQSRPATDEVESDAASQDHSLVRQDRRTSIRPSRQLPLYARYHWTEYVTVLPPWNEN